MKRSLLACSIVLTLCCLLAGSLLAQGKDVPDAAQREIARRGSFVERVGSGLGDDTQSAISEALKPPADDSQKWFISVVTTRRCKYCDNLKRDFASSTHLKPYVDVEDHTQSWAHYHAYQIEDQTQKWRFEGIKFGGYPTLIIQPPRNGRFGDPRTVVLQKTGYDGDAKKLAETIRSSITTYVRAYTRLRQAAAKEQGVRDLEGIGQNQPVIGYDPPFTPPPKVEPAPYAPNNYPFDLPPAPPGPTPAPQPTTNVVTILLTLLGSFLGSAGLTNFLLVALSALAVIRTFRKATGQKLLLDDETYQSIVDTLKSLIGPTKTPSATS